MTGEVILCLEVLALLCLAVNAGVDARFKYVYVGLSNLAICLALLAICIKYATFTASVLSYRTVLCTRCGIALLAVILLYLFSRFGKGLAVGDVRYIGALSLWLVVSVPMHRTGISYTESLLSLGFISTSLLLLRYLGTWFRDFVTSQNHLSSSYAFTPYLLSGYLILRGMILWL